MPLYIAQSGDLVRCHASLTESVTLTDSHLKDSATQLLISIRVGSPNATSHWSNKEHMRRGESSPTLPIPLKNFRYIWHLA